MKSHRIIIYIGVALAAWLALLPGSALASSLLSGYGGPGQGSQAILGSALLNGPKGGGSSGGPGSATGSSGTDQSAEAGSATGSEARASGSDSSASSGSSSSAPAGQGKSGTRSHQRAGKRGRETAASAASGGQSFYPAAERVPSGVGGAALGLSTTDLIYILLAAGIVVSLGMLTRRAGAVTRREGAGS
jgi:hypothetical protein